MTNAIIAGLVLAAVVGIGMLVGRALTRPAGRDSGRRR